MTNAVQGLILSLFYNFNKEDTSRDLGARGNGLSGVVTGTKHVGI